MFGFLILSDKTCVVNAKLSLDNSDPDSLMQILQPMSTTLSSLLYSTNAEKLCICKIRSTGSVLCLNRRVKHQAACGSWLRRSPDVTRVESMVVCMCMNASLCRESPGIQGQHFYCCAAFHFGKVYL